MSPDVLLECPRTSFRDVLRVNVTERVWHSPQKKERSYKESILQSAWHPGGSEFDDCRDCHNEFTNFAKMPLEQRA